MKILYCNDCRKYVQTEIKFNGGDSCYICKECHVIIDYEWRIGGDD